MDDIKKASPTRNSTSSNIDVKVNSTSPIPYKPEFRLNKDELIYIIESQIEIFELDFEDPQHGDIAKILHKHYSLMLSLIKKTALATLV